MCACSLVLLQMALCCGWEPWKWWNQAERSWVKQQSRVICGFITALFTLCEMFFYCQNKNSWELCCTQFLCSKLKLGKWTSQDFFNSFGNIWHWKGFGHFPPNFPRIYFKVWKAWFDSHTHRHLPLCAARWASVWAERWSHIMRR